MNRSNLEKLKSLYDNDPAAALAAETQAAAELAAIDKAGLNKSNAARAGFLLDTLEYCSMASSEPARGGGFDNRAGGVQSDRRSADERNHVFGQYLQRIAAAALEPGRRLGGKIETGVIHPELRSTGMEEATPSLGGFLVQTDFADSLFNKAYESSILWRKCRAFNISQNANGIKIPGIDEVSREDGCRMGGIRSYWLNEGGDKTATVPKFRNVEMILNKLTGLTYVTDELLEDASILAEVVQTGFQQEFSFRLDDAVIRGTGAGQPLGILNGPSLVSVTGASSANTLVTADVVACYAQLWPASEANAEWYCNRDALPQLMLMTLGDSGIWLPSGSLRGQPNATLLGKPIHFVEQASTVGDVGDLMLLDLTQYGAARKGGMQMATSIHVRFVNDETAFRFVLRCDGQPLWHSSLTPAQGTAAQSPFVAIATRT